VAVNRLTRRSSKWGAIVGRPSSTSGENIVRIVGRVSYGGVFSAEAPPDRGTGRLVHRGSGGGLPSRSRGDRAGPQARDRGPAGAACGSSPAGLIVWSRACDGVRREAGRHPTSAPSTDREAARTVGGHRAGPVASRWYRGVSRVRARPSPAGLLRGPRTRVTATRLVVSSSASRRSPRRGPARRAVHGRPTTSPPGSAGRANRRLGATVVSFVVAYASIAWATQVTCPGIRSSRFVWYRLALGCRSSSRAGGKPVWLAAHLRAKLP